MKLNHTTLLTAAISFGLVLTAGLMFTSFHYLVDSQQDAFDGRSQYIANTLKSEIDTIRDEVKALTTAFYALDNIDADTLYSNSKHTLEQNKAISIMLYAVNITNQQRQSFEAVKKDEGFISFSIQDYHNGTPEPATKRPTYLPISQIEPFEVDNVSLLGVDLLGLDRFSNSINHAIISGNDVAFIASIGTEKKALWVLNAIYAGFSGKSDPYFAKHSQEMFNGMVALKADIGRFIDPQSLPASIGIRLSVHNKGVAQNNVTLFQSGSVETVSIWSGMRFSNHVVFQLKDQDIILDTSHTLPWFDRVFLLFFLSGIIGSIFTALLVYSTRVLLKSELQNRAILDSALDAFISIDQFGIIQDFNAAAEQMFGYQSQDALGQDIANVIIPEKLRNQHRRGLAHYMRTGEHRILGQQLELIAIRSTNEEFPVEINITEIQTGKDRLFTAFIRDISSRKKAQEDLAQLATVVEQSFNAIIITDTEGIIQYVNPAFEMLSGYSANEALGQRPNIVKSGEHSDQYYSAMWQCLASGKNWSGSFINKAKDGHMYHVEQTIFPLYVADKLIGYTAVQQDVSERDRLQEQSEHTQRLESLGVLAGGIAHDFNNLLTAIMGNTGLALNTLSHQSPALKYLHNIQQASESAASLCQQMLAYSGKGHFIIQPMNLSACIDDILQLLKSSIAKQVNLNIQLDHNLAAIDADISQIKQVIMNLIINASEAIGKQVGCIQVKVTQVTLNQDDVDDLLGADDMLAGDFIALQVNDDGCGMNEETRKKIFDPFFTTKFIGRGLGMSAILGIIRGHRGGLKVTSQPGEGTKFDVYFPVSKNKPDQPVSEPVHLLHNASVQGSVLVVDDEEMLREIAKIILEDIGIKVILAKDGVEALELLHQHQESIDLVMLDMTMPKMGGEECFKHLRAFAPTLEVVICSGYAEKEVRDKFDNSGKIEFIQKPYQPKELEEKVKTILSL